MVQEISPKKARRVAEVPNLHAERLSRVALPVGTKSDKELVIEARNGSMSAAREIAGRYTGLVQAGAMRFLIDRSYIDEVVSSTFYKLFKSDSLYDVDRPLGTWLYSVAKNAARDINRPVARIAARTLRSGDALSDPFELLSAPQRGDSVIDQVLNAEMRERLHRFVETLPQREALLLEWSIFGRASLREMAARLEIRESTVKAALHKARVYLREFLLKELKKAA